MLMGTEPGSGHWSHLMRVEVEYADLFKMPPLEGKWVGKWLIITISVSYEFNVKYYIISP